MVVYDTLNPVVVRKGSQASSLEISAKPVVWYVVSTSPALLDFRPVASQRYIFHTPASFVPFTATYIIKSPWIPRSWREAGKVSFIG